MSERRDQLAANLDRVRERIAAAARTAGRDPADVTLVGITKTWPASDVVLLGELGVTDVGENRDQEAAPKHAEVVQEGRTALRWHMVGRLQTNKANSVTRWADVVQSVDRLDLVTALQHGAERAERRIGVCLQVSLDGDPERGGALPADLDGLAAAVAGSAALDLLGLMAVAPLGVDPARAFADLAEVQAGFLARHEEARMLSAGMSGDLEAAVAAGATHVRVGTALLGDRPPIVR
jgi:pyridoxal phosphate enzyme (YggS family)